MDQTTKIVRTTTWYRYTIVFLSFFFILTHMIIVMRCVQEVPGTWYQVPVPDTCRLLLVITYWYITFYAECLSRVRSEEAIAFCS